MSIASSMNAGLNLGTNIRQGWDKRRTEKQLTGLQAEREEEISSSEDYNAMRERAVARRADPSEVAPGIFTGAPNAQASPAPAAQQYFDTTSNARGLGPAVPENASAAGRGNLGEAREVQQSYTPLEIEKLREAELRRRGQYELADAAAERIAGVEKTAFDQSIKERETGLAERLGDADVKQTLANSDRIKTITAANQFDMEQKTQLDSAMTKLDQFVQGGGDPSEFTQSEDYMSLSAPVKSALVEGHLGINANLQRVGSQRAQKKLRDAGGLEGMVRVASEDKHLSPNSDFRMDPVLNDAGEEVGVRMYEIDAETGEEALIYGGGAGSSREGAMGFFTQYVDDAGVGAVYYKAEKAAATAAMRDLMDKQAKNQISAAEANQEFMRLIAEYPEMFGMDPETATGTATEQMSDQMSGLGSTPGLRDRQQ